MRSTPAGRDLPLVASHLRPLRRAWMDGSSTGPFPGLGKVATQASTCSYLRVHKGLEHMDKVRNQDEISKYVPRHHGISTQLSCSSSISNSIK